MFIFNQSSCCNFCSYYYFSLALLITGSHIVLISMLRQLRRFLWPSICADSLSLRIFQWCSLSMISTWSHGGRWSPFTLHMWFSTPDFSTYPCVLVFLKPHLMGAACFSFIFASAAARDSVHTVFSHILHYGGFYLGEMSSRTCGTVDKDIDSYLSFLNENRIFIDFSNQPE